MEEVQSEERWYIDIEGQVRPTTTKKIIESLLAGDFKVINRISRDRKNWKAICNEKKLDSVIEELIMFYNAEARKYEDQPENEAQAEPNTGFHNLERISNTIEEQLKHATRLQEINVRLNSLRSLAAEIKDKRKVVVDISTIPKKEEMHPDDESETVGAPSFWETLKNSLKVENKHRVGVLLVIFVLASGYFGVSQFLDYQDRKKLEAEKALAIEAMQAKSRGDYQKAVSIFEQVENIDLLDAETLVAMAEANIRLERYGIASHLINRARESLKPGPLRAQTTILLGLIALKTNQSEQAAMYYTESISEGPTYPALYNLAMIHLEKKNYQEAEELLLKAINFEEFDPGPTLMGLFESGWRIDEKLNRDRLELENEADRRPQFLRLNKVDALIEHANQPENAYSNELMAIQVMISAITGNQNAFKQLSRNWTTFALRPPQQKSRIPEVNYERTYWDRVYQWCVEVYKDNSLPPVKGLFFAQCASLAKSPADGIPFAKYAFSKQPDDPMARGYLAHLFLLNKQFDDARVLLRSGDLTGSELAQKTLEEVCQTAPDSLCPQADKAPPSDDGAKPVTKPPDQ